MFLYIIYLLISPFLWLAIICLGAFNRKIRTRLLAQSQSSKTAFEAIKQNRKNKTLILFHAASAGEYEQLKPLLTRIDRDKYFILQTFYSPTIFEKERNSSYFDAVCYQPFDFFWSVNRFYNRFNPEIYIITRHDIWPNHIRLARKRGIKTFLINANMYAGSSRLKWYFRHFSRWLYGNFDLIMTGSQRLQNQLAKLVPPDKIRVIGDTRFDAIIERRAKNERKHFPEEIAETDNIILGSIIKSDYEVVFGGIRKQYPDGDISLKQRKQRLIIVPHEADEKTVSELEKLCSRLGLVTQRYSTIENKLQAQTIIVDTVGILADLYAYAELAYVGAGFGAGVHSVIEPAVYGCVVSFGPNIDILDEAVELHESGAARMVHSADEFSQVVSLLSQPSEMKVLRDRSFEYIHNYENASQKVLSCILS